MNTTRNLKTSAPRKSWLQAAIVATVAVLLVTPMLPTASASLGDTGCFIVQATHPDGTHVGTAGMESCGPGADGGESVVVPPVVPAPVVANARLVGDCGTLGILGPGFRMSTDAPLPVGTEITITGSRIADIGNFSITGGAGEISSPSGTSRLVKLTQAIPAGATIELRSNLAMSKQFEMNARVSIPSGVELGSAAKVDAKITNTFLCTAS